MRTKMIGLAVAATMVGFATTASAGVITFSTDQAIYDIGDTITLTVDLDGEGEAMETAFIQTSYDDGLVDRIDGAGGQMQVNFLGGLPASLDCCDSPGFQMLVNQGILFPPPPNVGVVNAAATAQFLATAAGTFSFVSAIGPNTPVGQEVEFGTNPTPASVEVTIIPEPTTAALLGLGLFGLALGGRRR